MDIHDDTPASPVQDHAWNNEGALTPDHVSDGEASGNEHSGNESEQQPQTAQINDAAETSEHVSDNVLNNALDSDNHEFDKNSVHSDKNDDDDEDMSPTKRKAAKIVSSDEEDGQKSDNDDPIEKHVGEENSQQSDDDLSPKKRLARIDDLSDDEGGQKKDNNELTEKDEEADKIIGDIFGDESGNESDQDKPRVDSDDDQKPSKSKKRGYSDDEEDDRPKHRWDFDEMMNKKKLERKKNRKRHRDGGIDLISDNDEQIKTLVDQMTRAAALDRASNENRQPAFQKHKLLPIVRQTLLKQDLFEALLDNQMMSAVSDWLAPLPDKSLPSLEIRTTLLKILVDFPNLEQGVLRQSGLGKAVMYLLKHPREVKENKQRAARLIREWSRPIFQLESDYSSMTRDERIELDTIQQKKRRRSQDEPSSSRSMQRQESGEEILNPGQAGFVSRARVPRPSMKAYVNRPKPVIEGQFHGPSKARSTGRFDVAYRDFKDRTRKQKVERYTNVSVAGNKMEI